MLPRQKEDTELIIISQQIGPHVTSHEHSQHRPTCETDTYSADGKALKNVPG